MPTQGETQPGDTWYAAPGLGGYPGENPFKGKALPGQADEMWGVAWTQQSPEKQRQYLIEHGLNPDEFQIGMNDSGDIFGPDGEILKEGPGGEGGGLTPEQDAQQRLLEHMERAADEYQQYRPEVADARMKALRQQSMAFQPANDALATMYAGQSFDPGSMFDMPFDPGDLGHRESDFSGVGQDVERYKTENPDDFLREPGVAAPPSIGRDPNSKETLANPPPTLGHDPNRRKRPHFPMVNR